MILIDRKHWTHEEIFNYKGDDDLITQVIRPHLSYLTHEADWPRKYKWAKGVWRYNSKSKSKEGKKALWVTLTTAYNSNTGTHIVQVCQSVIKGDKGNEIIRPTGFWFKKSRFFQRDEIDYVLYMDLFSTSVGKTGSAIVLEDLKEEARQIAQERGKDSSVVFYLYNAMSPIYDDTKTIKRLAQAWGVPFTDRMSIDQVKNALHDKLKYYDAQNDEQFGYKALIDYIKHDSPIVDVLAAIQQARDRKVLRLDNGFNWILTEPDGTELEVLHKLSMHQRKNSTDALAKFLLDYEGKLEMLMDMSGYEPAKKTKEAAKKNRPPGRPKKEVEEPEQKSEGSDDDSSGAFNANTDFDALPYASLVEAAKQADIKTHGVKKLELLTQVKKHYITLTE